MDIFSIVRSSDETTFGQYRTKDIILRVYDGLAAQQGESTLAAHNGEVLPVAARSGDV